VQAQRRQLLSEIWHRARVDARDAMVVSNGLFRFA